MGESISCGRCVPHATERPRRVGGAGRRRPWWRRGAGLHLGRAQGCCWLGCVIPQNEAGAQGLGGGGGAGRCPGVPLGAGILSSSEMGAWGWGRHLYAGQAWEGAEAKVRVPVCTGVRGL